MNIEKLLHKNMIKGIFFLILTLLNMVLTFFNFCVENYWIVIINVLAVLFCTVSSIMYFEDNRRLVKIKAKINKYNND